MTSTTQLQSLCYESPTVTLNVMVREAAVSQWSPNPVVEMLRYSARFGNPAEDGDPIEIRGDRGSFHLLVDAVQRYIQDQITEDESWQRDRPFNAPYLARQGLIQHNGDIGNITTG